MAAMRKPFTGNFRLILQVKAVILALGALAVPPLVIGLSGTASFDALWTTLRLAALEGFTLIFLNIVTGSFRPLFNRVFKARTVQRFHVATGLAGFSIALAHGIMALIYGITGYSATAVWIGPTVLAALILTILTAITRRRLRYVWRWIHRLNYLIFAAVLVHGLILGYDLRGEIFLKVCFGIYAGIVAAGLVYRLSTLSGRKRAGSMEEATS
jgi:DMSO/TMAO reductase YedYZ heme-binding membrane subunit